MLPRGQVEQRGDPSATPGRDGAFRQTGLHNNDGKFRGLTRFRYYGEVLRPDLSNIAISTVALGIPVGKHSWIETIWHRYRQPVADNRIVGSRLNRNPNGIDKRLGDAFDVVISHRPPSGWVLELTGGVFRAGPAFGAQSGSVAGLAVLKVDYNF
jgi:alginate production protein